MIKSIFNRKIFNSLSFNLHFFQSTEEYAFREVLFQLKGKNQQAILNRPSQHNALNLQMLQEIVKKVKIWNQNEDISFITFKGEGKSFCSGGDLKSHFKNWESQTYETIKNIDNHMRTEFTLLYFLANMRPLQIAIMNGYVMGGATCLSAFSPIRIVTETAKFAMPEGKIGFFVDCCSSYYFPKLRSKIGYYLATTGKKINAQQMVYLNLADYLVKSENLPGLEDELAQLSESITIKSPQDKMAAYKKAQEVVQNYAEKVSTNEGEQIFPEEKKIEEYFSFYNLKDIMDKLNKNKDTCPVAQSILEDFSQSSPLSLKINYNLMQTAKFLTLKECTELDYRLSRKFMLQMDFYEGIQSKVINKNKQPKWQFKSYQQIPDLTIEDIFNRHMSGEELFLDEIVPNTKYYIEKYEKK